MLLLIGGTVGMIDAVAVYAYERDSVMQICTFRSTSDRRRGGRARPAGV
jgi:hypothetical protein